MLFIGRKDPNKIEALKECSDIDRVIQNAKKYFNDENVEVYLATDPEKKFMIFDPEKYKFIQFGAMGMKDYTYTLSEEKRYRYLKRSNGIKGKWRDNKYSANNLSREILWN